MQNKTKGTALCLLILLASGLGASARAQSSPQPTFFDEDRKLRVPTAAERRESRERRSRPGFQDTFLQDSLGGVADPLTGNGWAGTNPGSTDNNISDRSFGIFRSLPPRTEGSSGIFRSLP
ncbi:MAG: hypothetical protein AB4352_10335 [Hormoscilla sp.]